MSDIIRQINEAITFLQQAQPPKTLPPPRPLDSILRDAAAALIEAEAEALRLRNFNEGLAKIQQQLEAKNEEMKAALKQIATVCTDNDIPTSDHRMALAFVREVAEAQTNGNCGGAG